MRVSPDGNTHFVRQENGQVFADGGKQKAGWFREWQQGYVMLILSNTMDLKRFLPAQ